MEVVRKLESRGAVLSLSVKVSLDPDEFAIVQRFNFSDFRIKTRDGPFVGRQHVPRNMKSAYRSQLARIKGRWSMALVRTTGFVLVDTVLATIGNALWIVRSLAALVFGRRKSLRTATQGITVRSRRIETIREAELFIFLSLAAVAKAIDYAGRLDEVVLSGPDLLVALDGLDFAGAGQTVESEFEAVQMVTDGWSKLHG